MKILLVDDEPTLRQELQRYLERQGHRVISTGAGVESLALAHHFDPDVVVLDILLPDVDGIEVCRGLRSFSRVPVLILSVMGAEKAVIEALDAGADDYIVKPPDPRELLVRLHAIVRRASMASRSALIYQDGHLYINVEDRVLCKDGVSLPRSPREWRALACLLRNIDRPISHERLIRETFGPEVKDMAKAKQHLAVVIYSLRLAIEEDPHHPDYICTRVGFGYYFADHRLAEN
ncbi:MAG: response regulator transcription factor [Chloroflexi bacterium]|nr:response regulator transcription factor [Chloroflexota bacterium]